MREMKNNLPLRILGWIFFFVSGLFLGWIFFQGRDTVMTATMLTSRNAYLPRFMDKAYLVVAGIIWLFAWMYFEGYYSQAVKKGRLWESLLRLTGAELILLGLITVLPHFFTGTGVDWAGVGLSALALAAGVGLVLLARWMRTHREARAREEARAR